MRKHAEMADGSLPVPSDVSPEIRKNDVSSNGVSDTSTTEKRRRKMGRRETLLSETAMPIAEERVGVSGLSCEADEVVLLGARLQELSKCEQDYFQKKGESYRSKNASAEIYYESGIRHLYDETEILCDVISMTKANSLSGAAIQIAGALRRFWCLLSLLEDVKVEETYEMKRENRAIKRLLFSALGVVDSLADRKLASTVPFLQNEYLDPWTPVEERLKRIADKRDDELAAPAGAS